MRSILKIISFPEVLAPQRPPGPPTDYFQLNLGGYDPANLLKNQALKFDLPGYVGCIRGLQVGDTVIDLPFKAQKYAISKYNKKKF